MPRGARKLDSGQISEAWCTCPTRRDNLVGGAPQAKCGGGGCGSVSSCPKQADVGPCSLLPVGCLVATGTIRFRHVPDTRNGPVLPCSLVGRAVLGQPALSHNRSWFRSRRGRHSLEQRDRGGGRNEPNDIPIDKRDVESLMQNVGARDLATFELDGQQACRRGPTRPVCASVHKGLDRLVTL